MSWTPAVVQIKIQALVLALERSQTGWIILFSYICASCALISLIIWMVLSSFMEIECSLLCSTFLGKKWHHNPVLLWWVPRCAFPFLVFSFSSPLPPPQLKASKQANQAFYFLLFQFVSFVCFSWILLCYPYVETSKWIWFLRLQYQNYSSNTCRGENILKPKTNLK